MKLRQINKKRTRLVVLDFLKIQTELNISGKDAFPHCLRKISVSGHQLSISTPAEIQKCDF